MINPFLCNHQTKVSMMFAHYVSRLGQSKADSKDCGFTQVILRFSVTCSVDTFSVSYQVCASWMENFVHMQILHEQEGKLACMIGGQSCSFTLIIVIQHLSLHFVNDDLCIKDFCRD